MKEIVAVVMFFLVTLTVFSQSVSHYPGEPLVQRVSDELRSVTHVPLSQFLREVQ